MQHIKKFYLSLLLLLFSFNAYSLTFTADGTNTYTYIGTTLTRTAGATPFTTAGSGESTNETVASGDVSYTITNQIGTDMAFGIMGDNIPTNAVRFADLKFNFYTTGDTVRFRSGTGVVCPDQSVTQAGRILRIEIDGSDAVWYVNGVEECRADIAGAGGITYPIRLGVTINNNGDSLDADLTGGGPILPTPPPATDIGKLTNEDFKTEAQLITAGSDATRLLNDSKIYVLAIAKTFDDALVDGDIVNVDASSCSSNQYLEWDGSNWQCVDTILAQIPTAQFVGSAYFNTSGCVVSRGAVGFGSAGTNANCSAPVIEGDIQATGANNIAFVLPASEVKTNGYYKVVFTGLMYKSVNDGECQFSLTSNLPSLTEGTAYIQGLTARTVNNLTGNFRFSTGGDKTIEVMSNFISGTGTCQVYGSNTDPSKFQIHFFPDSPSLAAVQGVELCEVEAIDNDGEPYTPLSEDIPWKTTLKDNCDIWSNAGNTGSDTNDAITPTRSAWYSVKFSADFDSALTGGWSLYKNGVRDKEGDTIINAGVNSIYSGSGLFYLEAGQIYTIRTSIGVNLDNSSPNDNHYINWKEIPKSILISAATPEKTRIEARDTPTQAIGANNAITFNVVTDPESSWSGNTFTAPRTGRYNFSGSIRINPATSISMFVYQNGANAINRCNFNLTGVTSGHGFNCMLDMTQGDTAYIGSNGAITTQTAQPFDHYLYITEL